MIRRNKSAVANRIKNAKLKASNVSLNEPPAGPEVLDESTRGYRKSFGPPPHLSTRQRREMGINDPDSTIENSAAFDGVDHDIAAAFAPYYK